MRIERLNAILRVVHGTGHKRFVINKRAAALPKPTGQQIRGRMGNCRGGLGRTGMIAALLLVEIGMAPHEAIAKVRQAWPGAIQTREQEEFVRRCGRDFKS